MAKNNAWNSQSPMQVSKGGTANASIAAYTVVCGGTTSTALLQNVSGLGNANDVLTSQGAGALPQWAAPASNGSLLLISSQTANNDATIEFTSGLTTYNNLFLVVSGLAASTQTLELLLRLSNDGGANYETTGYLSGRNRHLYNSASWANSNINYAYDLIGQCTATGEAAGVFWIQDFNSTYRIKVSGIGTVVQTNPYYITSTGELSIAAPDAIQLSFVNGVIQSGTFSLYGLVE
jgi:hypothetical protein